MNSEFANLLREQQLENDKEYLQQNCNNNVCKYCGDKISVVLCWGGYQYYCEDCDKMGCNVDIKIFEMVKEYIQTNCFSYYEGFNHSKEYKYKLNMAKVCDMFLWFDKNRTKEIKE